MQSELAALKGAGIQVVAVSYDSTETLKEFADRAEIEFPLLSDPDSRIIDAYGIRNRDVADDSEQYGVPHPGTFLIDQNGVVRDKLFRTVRVRHSPQDLINAARD